MIRPRSILAISLFTFLIGLGGNARAERDGLYLLKSGYLFHFAQFIEWPGDTFASPDAPFVIAVYGHNPFGGMIRSLEQRTVHGRSIRVIELPDAPDRIPDVHMLFLPESLMHRFEDVRQALGTRPVALIGEAPGFAARGGVLNFYVERERVGFEINVSAAQHHQLVVSSRLLRLARLVEPIPHPPDGLHPNSFDGKRRHLARMMRQERGDP